VEIFFTLAGIVAVGVVVGYLVTPLIFYLMEVTAYVAVLLVDVQIKKRYARQQLGRFPKWNDLPDSISRPLSGHYCDNKKRRIEYPQPIHDSRPRSVNRVNITPVNRACKANTSNEREYCPTENYVLNMVNRQIIDKVSKPVHNLLSFYRRFYGHSTKVEKNPGNEDVEETRCTS
jgi:hypothetical protein